MSQRTRKVNSGPFAARYSRWIRKYTEVLNDPKIGMLSDAQYRVWDSVLLIAGTSPDGTLPNIEAIAFLLRKSETDTRRIIDELIDRGLIDIVAQADAFGKLRPHNWLARQFTSDGSALRMRRLRERRRNGVESKRKKSGDAKSDVTRDGICSVSVSAVAQATLLEASQDDAIGAAGLASGGTHAGKDLPGSTVEGISGGTSAAGRAEKRRGGAR